jgi:hypothetical protein
MQFEPPRTSTRIEMDEADETEIYGQAGGAV